MTHFRLANRNCMPARAQYPASNVLMNWFWNEHENELKERSVPRSNIVETRDDYRIELLAPGFSKSDFRIKVENQILTVSVESESAPDSADERYVRHEFSRKPFSRSFRLTNWVDSSNIAAKFENGILSVHIPKVEEAKAKPAMEIEIG
jgi:HSP20 family protein